MAEIDSSKNRSTKMDALHGLELLRGFIGRSQLHAIGDACRSEEKQFFFDRLTSLGQMVLKMPRTYDQDGIGNQAIAFLHYFAGGCDWYITERDSDPDGEGQIQAFGYANLGDDESAELGYISIPELIGAGVELDLYFTPKTLQQINAKKKA